MSGQKHVTGSYEGVSEVLGCVKLGTFVGCVPVTFPRTDLSMTFIIRQDIYSNLLVNMKLYLYRHGQAPRIPGG